MCKCFRAFGVVGIVLVIAAATGLAARDDKRDEKQAEWKGDIYTLDTCVVSGEKLGSMGAPVVKSYDGREVRFCCASCIPKFEADKATYLKRIDEQLIEQQMPHYPLTMCVVMPDDSLDAGHGEAVKMVHRNRLVRFCCPDCVKEFNAEPATYIAKLDEAVIKQQKDQYPLETCPVAGEKLGSMGEPVNYVVGTALIRFCCAECVKKFEQNPQPVITKVHAAWAAKHTDGHGEHEKPADKDEHRNDH